MKKIENIQKTSFLKKLFIKLCRIFGYEIIDQANFRSPTLKKSLNETLSVPGHKSITIPLGLINITRKVKIFKIILRTCTSELIMDQNKRRLFDCEKNEYTFRTLKSLIRATSLAKNIFKNIKFEFIVTDTNSTKNDVVKIKELLDQADIDTKFLSIDIKDFENKIKPGYSKAKFSNMANFYNSLLMAKNEDSDVIYFVEDDYIHSSNSIIEMIFSYEKFSTVFNTDPVLLPSDYPYLYTKDEPTKIYLGEKYHWRLVSESLVTFMTSGKLIKENFINLETMGIEWIDPWEKPLHEIYKKNPCLSPLPSLAFHCANINSVFGVSPNIDLKKLWDENK
jgi:hypothetical protein|tara:strand:+ start:317 stop:1327 length:1011 start_codon:yes stop_codon:yes gene_type:complete